MADERIDVEVTDKVSSSVERKLKGIGDAAGTAHSFVERLKTELGSLNTSALIKMESASNSTTRALAAQMNAQARLATATARSATEDAKAALQKQKLATETARTEAAQARAASAASNAASASLRAAQAAQRAADGTSSYASRAERLKSSLDPLYAAQSRFNTEMAEARTLLDNGAIGMRTYVTAVQQATGRLDAAKAAQNNFNAGAMAGGRTAGLAGHQMANLAAQVQDVGVSLAGGQPLWRVFIQQGSQISYIASTVEGGYAAIAKSLGAMALRWGPLIAIMGVAFIQLKSFSDEINARARPELEAYANSLGLTAKEMKKLEEESGGLTVTMGDMWTGFWMTVKEGLAGFSDEWGTVTNWVKTAWDATMNFLYNAFVGFYGLVVGGMRGIAKTIMNLPEVAGETAKSIANATLAAIEFMANKTIDAINWVSEKANSITSVVGIEFAQIGQVSLGRFERQGRNISDVFATEVTGAIREADNTLTAFGQRWDANARRAARDRIGNAAQEIIDDRTPGRARRDRAERDPKTQIDYINETTNALDNELQRMRMLKDEREVQQRLDQIEQEFIRRRMPLDQAQLQVFRDKIQAINDYKYVQSEMDRIVEEVQAPMRTYNATLEAARDLLDRNVISLERYNLEVAKAGRTLTEATDPLFKFREELDAQERALGLYGDAIEQNNYLETVRQQLVAQGYEGDALRTKLLSDEVQQLVNRNNALREQQRIQSTIGEIVNPMLDRENMLANEQSYYAELQRLRDNDVLNAQQYKQALYALDNRFAQMRLEGAQSFFGELAGLQSSSSKELAAIGKAAAIADATIKGYLAAQNALATVPYPFNIAAAAAIAIKTGANVAAIASTNVGSFANGGQFMVEGRAGIDNNNINMNVSRGERVTIETPAQQRANDGGGGEAGAPAGDVKIYNMIDVDELTAAITASDGFERAVLNKIKANPNAVQAANQ